MLVLVRRVSRDLLSLESRSAPAASPFLISPSSGQAGGALPFPSPPAALTHVPIPFPAPTAASATAHLSAASSSAAAVGGGPPRLKTFAMPRSALLSRVAAFLPTLAAANEKLAQDIARLGPEAVDIENLSTVPAESEEGTGSERGEASDEQEHADDDEEGDSMMLRSGTRIGPGSGAHASAGASVSVSGSGGMPRHIEMDLSLGVLEAQPHDLEGEEGLEEIVIPGIAQPGALLRGAGAAAGSDDSSGDDDDDSTSVRQRGGILLPAASASSQTKAARKKRKYRVKNKAKLAAAAAAAAASSSATAPPMSADTPPLPSPAKGGLIQLMEDE